MAVVYAPDTCFTSRSIRTVTSSASTILTGSGCSGLGRGAVARPQSPLGARLLNDRNRCLDHFCRSSPRNAVAPPQRSPPPKQARVKAMNRPRIPRASRAAWLRPWRLGRLFGSPGLPFKWLSAPRRCGWPPRAPRCRRSRLRYVWPRSVASVPGLPDWPIACWSVGAFPPTFSSPSPLSACRRAAVPLGRASPTTAAV